MVWLPVLTFAKWAVGRGIRYPAMTCRPATLIAYATLFEIVRRSIRLKFTFAVEQLKLEVWSVFYGSLVMNMLILFAGNIMWLFISGFIFGTMSGRGTKDFITNGFAALLSSLPILFFFNIDSIPGVSILSGVFHAINIRLAGDGLIMILSFILSGSGALAGSVVFRQFLKSRFAANKDA